MRALACVCLIGCWSGSKTPAHAPAMIVAPKLQIEAGTPGRLVIERDGTAWEVQCVRNQLMTRPWQGGTAKPLGRCRDDYSFRDAPIAIAGDHIAVAFDTTFTGAHGNRRHDIVVTRAGNERTYPITGYVDVVAIAFDGSALVLVVKAQGSPSRDTLIAGQSLGNSLAAIVRIDGTAVSVHELVRYGSTGIAVNASFVTTGRDAMLLVNKVGNTVSCDYRGACGRPQMTSVGEVSGAVPVRDGGMVVFAWQDTISRLDPNGDVLWTTKAYPMKLVGTTADQVWAEVHPADLRERGIPIAAFSLASGKRIGTVARTRSSNRDPDGSYLEIAGVAATPAGTVVRGTFGGTLAAGWITIATKVLGAVCWWSNPHDGDERPIDLDDTCRERYAKAILTEHRPFVAIDIASLRQP